MARMEPQLGDRANGILQPAQDVSAAVVAPTSAPPVVAPVSESTSVAETSGRA